MLTRPSDNRDLSQAPVLRLGGSAAAADPSGGDPDAVQRTVGSGGVLGNILFLGGGETVGRAIAFVGTSYLARVLEPAGFGIIGFATAIYAYLALTVAFVDDLGAREVAVRRRAAGTIAANVVLIRLSVALLAFCALGAVAWLLDKPLTVKFVIALTGLSFFSLALDTSWAHKGLQQNRLVSVAVILGQSLYVAMLLLIVKGPSDIARVPVAQFLGDLGAGLLLVLFLVSSYEIKLDLREGISVLRSSGYRFITKLLRTVILVSSWAMLGFMLGEKQVGLYTAAYRFCFLLFVIANAIHASYLPGLARLSSLGRDAVAARTGRCLELASAIALPVAVGGMLLAGPLLRTLFGARYMEGTDAFRFLILSMGFVFLSGAVRNVLLVINRLHIEMWIAAGAAAMNIALNFLVIPRHGIVGAAIVNALTEALILVIGLPVIYSMGIRPDLRGPLLRPLAASGVMGLSLVLLGPGRMFGLYLLVGLVVYLVALAGLRGIPEEVSLYMRDLGALLRWNFGAPRRSDC